MPDRFTLTDVAREALTLMARHPPERPYVLYRRRDHGPELPRFGDHQPWLSVPQAEVDALVDAGLLDEHETSWTITETGRRLVSTALPVPAKSTRRKKKG